MEMTESVLGCEIWWLLVRGLELARRCDFVGVGSQEIRRMVGRVEDIMGHG